MLLNYLFLTAVIFSLITFITQRKHLLMMLLSLEALILALTILTIYTLGTSTQLNSFLFIIILTFGACEASLGLSLLVIMTRSFGADSINLLNMNKC